MFEVPFKDPVALTKLNTLCRRDFLYSEWEKSSLPGFPPFLAFIPFSMCEKITTQIQPPQIHLSCETFQKLYLRGPFPWQQDWIRFKKKLAPIAIVKTLDSQRYLMIFWGWLKKRTQRKTRAWKIHGNFWMEFGTVFVFVKYASHLGYLFKDRLLYIQKSYSVEEVWRFSVFH